MAANTDWAGMTGKNIVMFNPTFSGEFTPFSVSIDPAIYFGITDWLDFTFALPGLGRVRLDVSGGKNLAIFGLWADSATFAPSFEGLYNIGKVFYFDFRVRAVTTYANPMQDWRIKGQISPIVMINPNWYAAVEFYPDYKIGEPAFKYSVGPCIGFMNDQHDISLKVYYNGSTFDSKYTISYELLYYIIFDLNKVAGAN